MVACSGNGMAWGKAGTKCRKFMTSFKFYVVQFGLPLQYSEEPLSDLSKENDTKLCFINGWI